MTHLRREFGMLVALIVLCGVLAISNDAFYSAGNITNTVRQIGMYGTFSIGLAFVIITGGIDLSVGSLIGLTGVLLAKFTAGPGGTAGGDECFGLPMWVAIPLVLGIVCLIGLAQGLLITLLDLQPFIVTLGTMLLLRGVSQTVVLGGSFSLADSSIQQAAEGGWPLGILIATILVCGYLLHFTVFGRYVYAIGGNRDAARYSGINVKRVETLTYVISAATAGLAGLCFAGYAKQMDQTVGAGFELSAIAAAVLGGTSLRGGEGTVLGVVIGTFVMRVIQNGITMFRVTIHRMVPSSVPGQPPVSVKDYWKLDTNMENIIIGGVILLAVILDQVTHIVQARRRTRKVAEPPAAVPPTAPTGGDPAPVPAT